jgi:hypothetical protein
MYKGICVYIYIYIYIYIYMYIGGYTNLLSAVGQLALARDRTRDLLLPLIDHGLQP